MERNADTEEPCDCYTTGMQKVMDKVKIMGGVLIYLLSNIMFIIQMVHFYLTPQLSDQSLCSYEEILHLNYAVISKAIKMCCFIQPAAT